MRRTLFLLALTGTGLACHVERRAPVLPADLVLRGGAIYTMWPERPWAEAIAVREGRIMFVGDDAGALRYVVGSTRVIDLAGRMVLPGFQDTHAHPLSGGLELGECNLYDARTPAEVEGIIRAYATANPDAAWIRGNGWQLPVFPGANPSREVLDRIVPTRPAFLYAADGHSAWANSKALELAGITRDTKDPPNGRIERDARTGEPSGTLREAAVGLVSKHLAPYTPEERLGAVRRALKEANRLGITSITDADAGPEYLAAYHALDERGELTARVTAALHSLDGPVEAEATRLRGLREQYRGGSRLAVNTVKLFADGVLEARTAAVLAPYLDKPGDLGSLNYTPEDLTARIIAFDRDGFQIHVHAIGDRAIRETLNALQHAREANGFRDDRPVIAHLELFDPADIMRFRELGVVASFQPYWAQADEYITQLTEPALGPVRSRWLYPIGSVLRSGATVVGGSDWTVSSLNPLDAIQVAITRRPLETPLGAAWIPEERVDLAPMLAAYTINAAYATHMERETGSLMPGKLADMIVIDRNLFGVPVSEIHSARVLMTLLDGTTVWADSTFAGP
ncbi:MAG: amidohydrolase [Gemmatimonadales bacterium]